MINKIELSDLDPKSKGQNQRSNISCYDDESGTAFKSNFDISFQYSILHTSPMHTVAYWSRLLKFET